MTVRGTLLAGLLLALAGCSPKTTQPVVTVPLSVLTILPASATLAVGEDTTFTITAIDTSGNPVPNPTVSFRSTNTLAVQVSSVGRATAVGEGTAAIIVTSGGQADTAFVLVLPGARGWFGQTSNTSNELRGVFFRPDGNSGWAVGTGGRVVATSTAGATWFTQTSNTAVALNSVWFTTDLEGWAAGDDGTIMFTTNAGATWTRDTTNTIEDLFDITFTARDTGFAVGSNGAILRTFDRGNHWTRVNPTAQTLRGVSFVTARDGWAVGDGGVIVGTHDRGLTWFVWTPSVTAWNLKSVFRYSLTSAIAVGEQGAAPRTVAVADSATWETPIRNAGAANQLEDVFFVSVLTGYAVGENGGSGAVLRTDDGGMNWSPQTANSQFQLNDVFFVDALRGWAVGGNGKIIHTATAGEP